MDVRCVLVVIAVWQCGYLPARWLWRGLVWCLLHHICQRSCPAVSATQSTLVSMGAWGLVQEGHAAMIPGTDHAVGRQ